MGFHYLLFAPRFLEEVSTAWNFDADGSHWFVLTSKLKRVKEAVKKLNTETGNLHAVVVSARTALLEF